jgi:hypothetical protein
VVVRRQRLFRLPQNERHLPDRRQKSTCSFRNYGILPVPVAFSDLVVAMSLLRRFALAVSITVTVPAVIACQNQLIPNTDVEDTATNRKIVEFCETYRSAIENRKVGMLLSLAHPKYYENGGNIDATDDIDRAGLKEFLDDRFRETRAIRYEIRYRRVQVAKDSNVSVDYTYSASYKIPGPTGEDVWHRQVADNRLELIPNEDSFLIIAGM